MELALSHQIEVKRNLEPETDVEVFFVPTVGSEEELVEAAIVASQKDSSFMGKIVQETARSRLQFIRSEEGRPTESDSELIAKVYKRTAIVREGTLEVIEKWIHTLGGMIHNHLRRVVDQTQKNGGTAIVIASHKIALGVICFRIINRNHL